MVEIQLSRFLLPYVASAVLTAGLTAYVVQRARRETTDSTLIAFTLIVSTVTVWSIARTGEFLFVDEIVTRVWIAILYVGVGGSAISVLFFALAFTGRGDYVTGRNAAIVLSIPLLAVGLAATNQIHNLFWRGEFVVVESGLVVFDREFNPAFFLYLAYTQFFFVASAYLLVKMALTSASVYRRQTIAFAAGSGVPIVLGVLFTLDAVPGAPSYFDPTPVGFAFTSLCFGYAIFGEDLLDLGPIARDTVIESMRDGYVVLDTKDRIVDHNDAAQDLLQATGELVGREIHTVMPEVASLLEEHEHGGRVNTELTVTLDGSERFLDASLSSLTHNDQTIGRLLLLRDVTERRAVQRRYQALIENSTDLIHVVEPDGTITYISPSIVRMGGDPAELEGENCFTLVYSEDRETLKNCFDEVLEDPGAMTRAEVRTADAAGNERVLTAVVRNMRDNPFIDGIVINARDITERKRREEELEAANERLDQFASVVSHDLRNPINVAKGHLDLAEKRGDEQHFRKVETALDRMESIIDDVLTLARQGESISQREAVALEQAANEAWSNVRTEDATLAVADDVTFSADPGRLLQLFENLFRNAVEHGGSDVTVTVGVEDDVLYVEDDGSGIPADERDEVLESGYTTDKGGTGLGLSIVEGVATAHDWEVAVTASSTGGARFEFHGIETDATAE